jgi:transcriptional regulator with XRE-family HTH domain
MEESMYERVLRNLEASKGRWADVAKGSGVSRRTVEKIARKEIVDPGVSHIEALDRYFGGQRAAA